MHKCLQSTDCKVQDACSSNKEQNKNMYRFNVLAAQLLKKGQHCHVLQLPFNRSDLRVHFQVPGNRKTSVK